MPQAKPQAAARSALPLAEAGLRVARAPAMRKAPRSQSSRKAGGLSHHVPQRRNVSANGVRIPKTYASRRLTWRCWSECFGEVLIGTGGFLLGVKNFAEA